jgi:hypothetical protein
MVEGRFDASERTTSRWRNDQKWLLLRTLPFGGVILIEVFASSGRLRLLILSCTFLAFCFTIFGLILFNRRMRGRPMGNGWSGYGYVSAFALRKAGIAGSIEFKSEGRLRYWTQGRGMIGGRMGLDASGLQLSFGMLSRVAGVKGEVCIPWNSIRNVEVGKVPGVLFGGSGGGISIDLISGYRLDGRFVGSSEKLLLALSASPLADQ